MVDEAGFVAEAGSIDDPIVVEVEEEGEVFAVVYDAASFCFLGRYNLVFGLVFVLIYLDLNIEMLSYLACVFAQKVSLFDMFPDVQSESNAFELTLAHYQSFRDSSLEIYILTTSRE